MRVGLCFDGFYSVQEMIELARLAERRDLGLERAQVDNDAELLFLGHLPLVHGRPLLEGQDAVLHPGGLLTHGEDVDELRFYIVISKEDLESLLDTLLRLGNEAYPRFTRVNEGLPPDKLPVDLVFLILSPPDAGALLRSAGCP